MVEKAISLKVILSVHEEGKCEVWDKIIYESVIRHKIMS